ncbi:MAG TPA: type II toxin-antitoxin system VapC family toxin [Rhizomicrobium sp.]|jgi:predicted nucleic acid-binding protein
MAALIVDSSVVLAAILPDEAEETAEMAMEIVARRGAWIPAHWPLEIANALLAAQIRKRITPPIRRGYLRDLTMLPVQVDSETWQMAWGVTSNLAERHGLTLYDAAYLELAARKRLPLATLDGKLLVAARKEDVATFGIS